MPTSFVLAPDLRQGSRDFVGPIRFLCPRDFSRFGKHFAHARVHLLFESGKNFVPYAVAGMPQVFIASVLAPALPDFREVRSKLRSTRSQ